MGNLIGVPFFTISVLARTVAAMNAAGPAPTRTLTGTTLTLPAAAVAFTAASHCPTITETGTVCPYCTTANCLYTSTLTNPCDCPKVVPTVSVDFDCGHCPSIACTTEYVSTTYCPAAAAQPTNGLDAGGIVDIEGVTTLTTATTSRYPYGKPRCGQTVTVNAFPKQGCIFTCTFDNCAVEKPMTVPCGCATADVVTLTKALPCPSRKCHYCTTAFPTTVPGNCHFAAVGGLALSEASERQIEAGEQADEEDVAAPPVRKRTLMDKWIPRLEAKMRETGMLDPEPGEYSNQMPVERWRCPDCLGQDE